MPLHLGPAVAVSLGLLAAPVTVEVAPGGTASVTVEIPYDVPARPAPLDVFFVVDTTGSMFEPLPAIQAGIVRTAKALRERYDVCVGVGEVNDYSPDREPTTQVYQLHRAISCDLGSLPDAVEQLDATGGAGQVSATIALTQAATGTGQFGPPSVPEGLDAGFRPEARRLVVLVSDGRFRRGEDPVAGYHPSIEGTVDTLNEYGIDFAGIAVTHGSPEELAYVARDMVTVAEGTDTVAPEAGIDCDGDGDRDVAAGGGLVCPMPSGGEMPDLAPVVALLPRAINHGLISVEVSDPHGVVRAGGETASQVVDLNVPARLRVSLTVGCVAAQAGRDLPVMLLGPGAVEVARVVVRCRAGRETGPDPAPKSEIPPLPPSPTPEPVPPDPHGDPPPPVLPQQPTLVERSSEESLVARQLLAGVLSLVAAGGLLARRRGRI